MDLVLLFVVVFGDVVGFGLLLGSFLNRLGGGVRVMVLVVMLIVGMMVVMKGMSILVFGLVVVVIMSKFWVGKCLMCMIWLILMLLCRVWRLISW